MNKKRSATILFKAISRNFFKIVVYYPKMVYMAFHQSKYTVDEMYAYCLKMIRFAVDTAGLRVEAYGLENIPSEDGFYLCSNHQEKFDPLAIWYSFPRQVGVILDDVAVHRPFIREVCRLIRSKKLIKHNTHSVVKAYSEITDELKKGINYMVFPEGGYEEEQGKLSEFMAGSFKSPQRAHCKILPVTIVDSFRIFDHGFRTTKPIQVHYLKPIAPEEYENMSTVEIAELVKSRIQEHLEKFQA